MGRPVKWTCERREALLTDYQARDLVSHVELALDADGTFLALRGVNTSNVGAHAVSFIPLAKGVAVLPSLYHVPAASLRGRDTRSALPGRIEPRPAPRAQQVCATFAQPHGMGLSMKLYGPPLTRRGSGSVTCRAGSRRVASREADCAIP